MERFHPGNPAYKDDRYEDLKARLDYYFSELGERGVNKKLLWDEYRESNPDGYSYSQFCYHLYQQQVARKPSAVLHHQPGEKLYIDFAGKPLSYVDRTRCSDSNGTEMGVKLYHYPKSSAHNSKQFHIQYLNVYGFG